VLAGDVHVSELKSCNNSGGDTDTYCGCVTLWYSFFQRFFVNSTDKKNIINGLKTSSGDDRKGRRCSFRSATCL
jgi:hypothetical protein